MNDKELTKLQHNLTRSAKKAKKHWVRGMVGFKESDQGFFPIVDVPIISPFTKQELPLGQVLQESNLAIKKVEIESKEITKELNTKLDNMTEKYDRVVVELNKMNEAYDSMESNYKQILEKGLAEYIKVLANL